MQSYYPPMGKAADKSKIYGSTLEDKVCPTCSSEKPATTEFFYARKRRNGRYYLSSSCRACGAARAAKDRSENPEKCLASSRSSRLRNHEKISKQRSLRMVFDPVHRAQRKSAHLAWRTANPVHVFVYRRAYREENAEKLRARDSRYYRETMDAQRAYRRNRRARLRNAQGAHRHSDVMNQISSQSCLCFWCKSSLDAGYHVDHYIPLARGGSNFPTNIVISCPTCNVSRGAKMPSEFIAYLATLKSSAGDIEIRRAYLREKMREHRARRKKS